MTSQSALHTIEAYPIDSIKAEAIAWDIPGCPLSAEIRRKILAECPVVIDWSSVDDLGSSEDVGFSFTAPRTVTGYETQQIMLRQPSVDHRRSFELKGELFEQSWQDEYNNTYASYNLKGNNFTNPGVMEHPTAVDQYVAWGLQESKIIERVLKVSNVLRARGVSTEYIVGLSEPKHYLWPQFDGTSSAYEAVALDEYRRRIVQKYWSQLPEGDQTLEGLADIQSKLNNMTFYISMRATDTAFRLRDLSSRAGPGRAEVYDYINQNLLSAVDEPLDPNSFADWTRYLQRYLAPRLGVNIAKMHTDLAHGFLHNLNITALGGIVDTDSVFGEPLGFGDAPITNLDRAKDIFQAALEICRVVPMDMKGTTRQSVVQELFAAYIYEVIESHETFSGACEQLSGTIGAIEENFATAADQQENIQTLNTFKEIYCEMLTVYIWEEKWDSHEEAFVQESIDTSDVPLADITAYVAELMPEVIEDIILDHVNHEDMPVTDILKLLEDNEQYVFSQIKPLIFSFLHGLFLPEWTRSAEAAIPALAHDVGEGTLHLLYLSQHKISQKLASLSEDYIPAVFDAVKAELKKTYIIEAAEPFTYSGRLDHYYDEPKQFFWNSSETVSLAEVFDELKTNELEYQYAPLGYSPSLNFCYVEVSNPGRIHSVITNGVIDGVTHGGESRHFRFDITHFPSDEPAYALIKLEDENGEVKHILQLPESFMGQIKDSSVQDTLF